MSGLKDSADALGAEVATQLYGVTGGGIKIGIISDSYDANGGAAANVASGNLPQNVAVESDSFTGTDEGQAMTELAYQVAPGASYYFATCGDSLQSFAAAVTTLQSAGCAVIVDDVTFPSEESFYQTGTVLDLAIEAAVAAGANYFTATGNGGDDYVQLGFAPISVTVAGISPFALNAANFGATGAFQDIAISSGANVTIDLEWAQPFATIGELSGGARNSLAFYLINSSGRVVASSTQVVLGDNPVQTIQFTNYTSSAQFRLVVVENGGTTPSGQSFTISVLDSALATLEGPDAGTGAGSVMGHALISGVNAVGAVTYSNTPAFGASPAPAFYTATGTGTILYNSQGQLLATPASANAPGFLSVSGSSTTVAGFAPFAGTSAAAPTAGAVGALMLQANGALTTVEVTALLDQSAIPVPSTVEDVGAGLIQARAAVELSVSAAGTRWSAASGGNWSSAANWSAGTLPSANGAVMLSNDLGVISGSYGLTVNTPSATAGALTLSAPAGQTVTLTIGAGDGLAVGGPAANDITAGDFLVGVGGTLSMSGGTLSVSGSLNSNAGTVVMTGGEVTAGNYTQDAGGMIVTAGTIGLTGAVGFAETGGQVSIGTQGVLDTTAVSVSAATVTVAGTLDDLGILSTGTSGGIGVISVASTGSLSIGGAASGVGIAFSGNGGLLDFTSDSASVLTGGLTSIISGFDDGSSVVAFGALTYNPLDTTSYASGTLTIQDGSVDLATLALSASEQYGGFDLIAGTADRLEVVALACFAAGTCLWTERGAVAVETLAVGDLVITADGGLAPITWTGLRRVECGRHREPAGVLPVRISAHAFGDGLPGRDLFLSPDHAVYAEGVLIPVKHLIDGALIRQVTVAHVTYVHIELSHHQLVLAEGLPVESYLDAGDRAGFSGGPVVALHPEWGKHRGDVAMFSEALAYAPLRVTGAEVDRVRAKLAVRCRHQCFGGASSTRLTD